MADHPAWARRKPDGAADSNETSTFAAYADRLMIPELEEAISRYDLDGAWIDGECWATHLDYCDAAVRGFREATGLAAPKDSAQPGWQQWKEFNRAQFRKYVRKYLDAIHSYRPQFQIASNWAYTTFMPERPELPVDYLSGDFLGNASIATARLDARYLAQMGKAWDLMAWGFNQGSKDGPGFVHKPAVQIEQEAAVVLAQGGGFQVYHVPTRAGKIDPRHIAVMASVGEFCRARKPWCRGTEIVPQAGVLFSTRSLYNAPGPALFGGWGAAVNPALGVLDAVIENHIPADVIPEWKLDEVGAEYPTLVVPDWKDLDPAAAATLVRFATAGARLVVIGAQNCALFEEPLGVRRNGAPKHQDAFLPGREVFGNVSGEWQTVTLNGAQPAGYFYPTFDSSRDEQIAATTCPLGKGLIAGFYGPLGEVFARTQAAAVREVFGALLRRIFEPAVTLDGPPTVELVLRKKDSHRLVHLLNATAMQVASEYATTDFVPTVGPMKLTLRLARQPRRVSLEPDGAVLNGAFENGVWTGLVPKLEIYSTVVFEA